jgi:hypothetical protein
MIRPRWSLVFAMGLVSCSAGGDSGGLVVGSSGTGGGTGAGGAAATGGIPITGLDASSKAFEAHIENTNHVVIELVTLSCAGECANVLAVAKGGHEPYAFRWDDGPSDPARRLCPEKTSTFSVSVTDSGYSTPEFQRAPETRRAAVTTEMLGCSGKPDGGADAGAPGLCLKNPSFEGVVTQNQFSAFEAAPWNSCYAGGFITYSAIADATLWPQFAWAFPPAADGATYLALGQQLFTSGRASQVLCHPIPAGDSFSFLVELAQAPRRDGAAAAADQAIEVLGGTECAEDEVLWTSPQLSTAWTTYCVTVRPTKAMASLGFRARGTPGAEMEGLVDNLVPVTRCQ